MELKQITFDFDEEPSSKKEVKSNAVKKAEKPVELKELLAEKNKPGKGRRSTKNSELRADLLEIPEDEILFQKQYYGIKDVAEMFKEPSSLIRFWANNFDILKPMTNKKGDRRFRPEDVKNLRLIYHLLRERKYTIEGAKDFLKKQKKAGEKYAVIESLQKLKSFLFELKMNL